MRPARSNDALLLFRWRNDVEFRRHSGERTPTTWFDHKRWLRDVLIDATKVLLIGETYGPLSFPVGSVQLDQSGSEHIVSVTVDPLMRRMGYGHAMVSKLVERHSHKPMMAYVRHENTQSLLLFQKCGFKLTEPTDPIWYQLRRDPCPGE